jgi:nitrogen regulatory protein P-II 1
MKMLTLVVHANLRHELADVMRDLPEVHGFTFTRVQGHGSHVDVDPFLSSSDRVVGYTPRIKAEILLADEAVQPVLARLRQAMCHEHSRGSYWVGNIDESGVL